VKHVHNRLDIASDNYLGKIDEINTASAVGEVDLEWLGEHFPNWYEFDHHAIVSRMELERARAVTYILARDDSDAKSRAVNTGKRSLKMSYSAKVFQILIASPSDVPEERQLARELIHEWNTLNAAASQAVMLPVMWETHTTPQLGERPQSLVNTQIVDTCDALIGIFWTRIGTPTGVAESGSVEEIERFVQSKKPALIYFSTRPIVPSNLDAVQFERLKTFRTKCEAEGLIDAFGSIDELRQKLLRHLTFLGRQLSGDQHSALNSDVIPVGGSPYQVLQRGPSGELVWDHVRVGP
jgi:hypothetical protein